MEHFYNTLGENWFSYPSLYSSMVKKFGNNSKFVEIGTWKGMSAVYMAVEIINSGKKIKFDCVDTWEYIWKDDEITDIDYSKYDNLFNIFLKNIEPVKSIITPIKEISWEAAKHYNDNTLDFVFIDAGHDYASVIKDLNAWYPKVKIGGIISGHDYTQPTCGVKKAVDEFFNDKKITELEGCWIYEKLESLYSNT